MEYIDFLKSKMVIAPDSGFDIDPSEVNQELKPHQRDVPTLFDLLESGTA